MTPLQAMTEAEYLAWEDTQELRHEFDGVRPVAMNGGTVTHERLLSNLNFALMTRLRGERCEPFGPNMRVPTTLGRYRYPDAVVTCAPQQGDARDLIDPVVIFEVMSETTQRTDRSTKLVEYRAIPSLIRYVMLEQDEVLATVITRVNEIWSIDVLRQGDTLDLPEIGIALPLGDIYAGTQPQTAPP